MSEPTVSCIMPVYNGEKYLAESIDSVLAQTYSRIELIVMDDGSTDGTAAEAKRYGGRIRYLHQPNAGVSAARNRAIEESSGQLIAFLDGDDLWHPQKTQRQVQEFAARPELGLCDCFTDYFWSPELTDEQLAADKRYDDSFWRRKLSGHISTWLARRELVERVGIFKVGMAYAEDVDWILRVRDSGAVMATLPDTLTSRRLHANNVTAHSRGAQKDGLTQSIKAHLERLRKEA